ncbi:protein of unknown function [Shewanella benthica]|uniref:Uncharacterized protein n=1 Tax=Shewanella benthica TaxID=43661 RepID=A0A330LW12_9GAMM|nr:hypothetical protein [Shewanella benthica]SQH74459.1 protein of unknown function [Shewanella benthica]
MDKQSLITTLDVITSLSDKPIYEYQRQLASFAEMEAMIKANAMPILDFHIKRFDGTYYMTQPILATA